MIPRLVLACAAVAMTLVLAHAGQAHDHIVPHVHPHSEMVGWSVDLKVVLIGGSIAAVAAVVAAKLRHATGLQAGVLSSESRRHK